MPEERVYKRLLKHLLPDIVFDWLVKQKRRFRKKVKKAFMGAVDFGNLRRTIPVSKVYGADRGLPIDRYYIEKFLESRSKDIKGHVLELSDSYYTDKFGKDKVTKKDVLHVVEGNPEATIIADLSNADQIPSNLFDCIIFTQSLQMIYDFRAALLTLHRILKPGGVLLCTTAGISKIGRRLGEDDWGEYWHFTSQSASLIFNEAFPNSEIEVNTHGNVLSAICFLHGLAVKELTQKELDYLDPNYEVIITVRVAKEA